MSSAKSMGDSPSMACNLGLSQAMQSLNPSAKLRTNNVSLLGIGEPLTINPGCLTENPASALEQRRCHFCRWVAESVSPSWQHPDKSFKKYNKYRLRRSNLVFHVKSTQT